MSKQRRSFSVEFKHDAAALVVDQGYSVAEACKSMGVGQTAPGAGSINCATSVVE